MFQSWFEVIFTWNDKEPPLFTPFDHCGVVPRCDLKSHSNYLCFTILHRTNNLVLRNDRVTKKQLITHQLISYLHYELGWSYRKITKWLNRSGIKTHKGKLWGVTGNSVYSVLKRFKEREERMNLEIKKYGTEVKHFEIRYLRNQSKSDNLVVWKNFYQFYLYWF